MEQVRCRKCNKLLGLIEGKYSIKCPRCGDINEHEPLLARILREHPNGGGERIPFVTAMNTNKESVKDDLLGQNK